MLFSWGSEGETVKTSAERPIDQVMNLGVQGGPDGENGLRIGEMKERLLQLRKLLKSLKLKVGAMSERIVKKRTVYPSFIFIQSFGHFELSPFKKLHVLVRIHRKPGFFFKFQSLLIFEVLTDVSSCHSAL